VGWEGLSSLCAVFKQTSKREGERTVLIGLQLSVKFFLKITNPASCLHHFLPRRDPIQLDHTNTTQDPPPAQNATAHSFNMAFLTISLGFRIDRNVIIITLNCLYVCMYVCTCFIHFIDCIALCCSIHLFSYCCKYANKSSSSSSTLRVLMQ